MDITTKPVLPTRAAETEAIVDRDVVASLARDDV